MDTDRTAPEDVGRHLVGLAGEAPAVVPIVVAPERLDRNPAAVYLAGKPSATGRRGLKRSLDRAAELLTSGRTKDAMAVDWTEVRYQHVTALRSVLIEEGAKPATVNHVLAAVRGTLKEAWRLGQIDAETLARACDVSNVTASHPWLPVRQAADTRLEGAADELPVCRGCRRAWKRRCA